MNIKRITDNYELLDEIVKDSRAAQQIYRAGPYWEKKALNAVKELKRLGLSDFRSASNGIGTSFCDNLYIDTRLTYNYGLRSLFNFIYKNIYPFNTLFNSQVNLTSSYANESIRYKNEYLRAHSRFNKLITKYKISFETTRGGCISFLELNGEKFSHHYLELLSTLDYINEDIVLTQDTRFFEIGGGFGTNVHLLVELFDVRKIIYLDIAPNLYVGTQYLKSFYGENVIDYSRSKNASIRFKENSELEIFCILPHQIENISTNITVFHNAHSFVEMPINVVKNYANHIQNLMVPGQGHISLVSYDGFDVATTFDPDLLPSFFSGSIKKDIFQKLQPDRVNFHYTVSF